MSRAGRSPPSLVERTVDLLGRAILKGDYPPGTTLPFEADLALRLGVGRNVVREAIKVLGAKRLIRTGRRIGSTVLPKTAWSYFDDDVIAWSLAHEDLRDELIDELNGMRVIVEPEVAALAATAATTTEILRLYEAYEQMERHAADRVEAVEADIEYHRRLFEACHNKLLASLMRNVIVVLRANFALALEVDDAVLRYRYLGEHRTVADAIRARDPQAARGAMQELLQNNRRNILDMRQLARQRCTSPRRPAEDSPSSTRG